MKLEVILTIIGWLAPALLAYYFGKRAARKQTLYERRTKALDGIRARANSIHQVLGNVMWDAHKTLERPYFQDLLNSIEELADRGEKLMGDRASLCGYYAAEKPYLEPRTRELFEAFDQNLVTILSRLTIEAVRTSGILIGAQDAATRLGAKLSTDVVQQTVRNPLRQAVSYADEQITSLAAALAELDLEAERVAGTRSLWRPSG